MLTVEALSVWYGPTEVLRSVSLEVAEGTIVALLGGNGAGKTTTLNALSGLVRPKAGTISIDGRRIDGQDPHDILTAGVSQVPQGRFVWPSLSVFDNIRLGAVTRRNRSAISEDMDFMLETFPVLRERLSSYAGTLSGGQQQMLAIARALMSRPRYLLMDEPSHGLAPKILEEIIELIRAINKTGMAILLVEQNVGVAAALAEDVCVLKHGEIALQGKGNQIFNSSELLHSYLGQ